MSKKIDKIYTRSYLRIFLPMLFMILIFTQGIFMANPTQTKSVTTVNPLTKSEIGVNDIGYEWLILNYLDGDNNLEENAMSDINELEEGFNSGSIKVLALLDRTPGYDTTDGDWTGTRLYEITHDIDYGTIASTLIKDFGELNMGDGDTLELLLEYGLNNYSSISNRIWLNLWDHGGGIDGICWDDSSSGDSLKMDEMQQAIYNKETEYSRKIDLISHDACLMNMIEVANELKDLADFYVGSEETVPVDGFDYFNILDFLSTNPTTSAENLAIALVDFYEAYYDSYTSYVTLSALNLSVMDNIIQYTNYFAGNLSIVISDGEGSGIDEAYFNTLAFYDLYVVDYKDFVLQILENTTLTFLYPDLETAAILLLNEFDNLIISNYQHSVYSGKAYGVSIFMPIWVGMYETYIDHYIYDEDLFENIDWLTETLWDEFLDDFYSAGFGVFSEFTPLELGLATGVLTVYEYESHFYQITIDDTAVYELSCQVLNGDADLYLYTMGFTLIGLSEFYNPEDGSYERIQMVLFSGIYIIEIYGFWDSNYDLIINQKTIEEIPIGGTRTATAGSQDGDDDGHYRQVYGNYYQVVITDDDLGSYSIDIEYNSLDVDFDLYIYTS
ncbi:MAG: hypothetical protein FK734_21200, partial [Asgard group archaeon]|nr:hypothetical protein [Asgard group archaeon]